MTKPRSSLVSPETTPYYHCVSRCVRRAFLCGRDDVTGKSFEHRRAWIVERLGVLSRVFAVDVCAYAAMNNHLHLVVRLKPHEADSWTMDGVLDRWCTLFAGPILVQRYRSGDALSHAEHAAVATLAEEYRARLRDLSWFMRCINEPIARWANAEDGCTGRFWEGRFSCQALLDEKALLSCMAYVDLNPIRADRAQTPETSPYTSIQQRIAELDHRTRERMPSRPDLRALPQLLQFADGSNDADGLPFTRSDYLALVDWSGRAVHPTKVGRIPADAPPILERLSIAPPELLCYLAGQSNRFYRVIGAAQSIRKAVAALGQRFLKGISAAQRVYPQRT